MQPFTLDQSIITGMLFLLGILIGMFFLAGGKWKRRYRDEVVRREALDVEVEHLRRDAREREARQRTIVPVPPPVEVAPAPAAAPRNTDMMDEPPLGGPYRKVTPTKDGQPDIVIRRP